MRMFICCWIACVSRGLAGLNVKKYPLKRRGITTYNSVLDSTFLHLKAGAWLVITEFVTAVTEIDSSLLQALLPSSRAAAF